MAKIDDIVGVLTDKLEEPIPETLFSRFRFPESELVWLREDRYYRALYWYCQLVKPRHVLELGTLHGCSAAVMSEHSGQITTYDLDTGPAIASGLPIRNINLVGLPSPEFCLTLPLDGYDLIFVDIDHSGQTELKLHEKFVSQYQGIVFWDDVALNPGMLNFWNTIQQPKYLSWWHYTGFGIVQYC